MLSRRAILLAALANLVSETGIAEAAKPLTFEQVQQVVDRELHKSHRDVPGCLLSRGDVTAVLAELQRQGWQPTNEKQIIDATLPDQHFLVRMLREPRAKAFVATVSKLPNGYDRVEHLSRLPDGPSMIDRLIDTPDGAKMIEYMATTDGGRNLGDMLSASPNGEGFNKPTGHLYTRDDLISRLRKGQPKGTTVKKSPKGK